MPDQPQGPEPGRERGEEFLPLQMRGLRLSGTFGIPEAGAHARRADQLDDLVVGERLGRIEHRHPPVYHIKGQMFLAADLGAEHPVEDRHLFGAVKPVHAETAALGVHIANGPDIAAHRAVARTAAGAATLVNGMRVVVIVIMFVIVLVSVMRHRSLRQRINLRIGR